MFYDLSDDWTEFEHNGLTFAAKIEYDDCHGAPWEEECGHGPVTGWTRRAKLPGELVLNEDRGSKRYYDFAEACRIARKEAWGFAPGRLEYSEVSPGRWLAHFRSKSNGKLMNLEGEGATHNAAISALYAAHRATMTPRAYSAAAAMADFERLRGWCADSWHYVGVIVAPVCTCCGEVEEDDSASLWGIESDSAEYLAEVAQELADELTAQDLAAA